MSATVMAAMQLRLKIPDDLSLLMIGHGGNDSLPLNVDTVVIPFHEIGRCAVQQLLQKIDKPDELLPTRVLPAFSDLQDTSAPPANPKGT
jgi:DNA-binding LacI/PurR family transcriptional regulator